MIDWINHDGVMLSMINDHVRNQFFDCVLSDQVRDRDCIDIGFGTGLLSFLALTHGARSITAVESDPERYRLGQEIITRCGFQDRIRLFNLRYQHDMPLYVDNPVIFSETVNGNLWQEGLWNSLPRQSGQTWLPNNLFLEIHSVSVPHSFGAGLYHLPEHDDAMFDPGVDLPDDFVYEINQYLGADALIHGKLAPGIHALHAEQVTPWGPKPWMRSAINQHELVGHYELDINQCSIHIEDAQHVEHYAEIDFDHDVISLVINCEPSHTQPMILVPRCGLSHASNRLYLDHGHWGAMQHPVIATSVEAIQVVHNTRTGNLTYEVLQ